MLISIMPLLCFGSSDNLIQKAKDIRTNKSLIFEKKIIQINNIIKAIPASDTPALGEVYHVLGGAYIDGSEVSNKTLEALKKAIFYKKKSHQIDSVSLARTYYNLEMYWAKNNNLDSAKVCFIQVINLANKKNDRICAKAHNELSKFYYNTLNYAEAERYAYQAIKQIPKTDTSLLAGFYIDYANIFLEKGNFKKAKYLYYIAHNLLKTASYSDNDVIRDMGITYANLGMVHSVEKDYKKAINFYDSAHAVDNKINIFNDLFRIYLEKGDYRKAKEYLDKAKTKATDELLANTYDNYTTYYLAINNLPLAIKYNKLALALISKTDPTLRSEILINKLEISRYDKNLKEAIGVAYRIDKLADSVRNNQNDDGSKIIWRKKIIAFYQSTLSICHELKDTKSAYFFMEKSRAVVLQEALRKASMGKQNAPSQVLSLGALQKKLADKDNQTYLSYFVGDSAIYAFVVNQQKYDFKKLALSRSRYDALSTDFLKWCSGQTRSDSSAKKLYNLLFAPLHIPVGQRVIVSTNAALLPFGAFINDAGKYLVHDYPFSYAFSASLLFDPPKLPDKPQARYQFLAIQPHTFEKSKLNPLPDTNNSIKQIRKLGYWGKKYFEGDATKNNVLDEAKRAKIIYFFTHADANENNAQIYLWDESLHLEDIYALQGKIASDLVCFAACKTAVGKAEPGEGVMSFARAFAYAGVPSIATTLWNVDSGYTGSIYSSFFENMSQQHLKDKDIALQMAQINFLKDPNKNLPINWAGLVILGDTKNIGNNNPATQTLLTIALCLVFGSFLWWWKSKES